ncbi:MAG: hypothetical protein IJ683_07450 [Butyrivibrio sp.]|nr:hypothetical protein [Butyrivibrio sp.]MBR1642140.1 hypothetical protein [Butyrivibrio sp.]
MSFMEEYRALLQAVEDFDHQSVDLTTLSDADLHELETSRLPLFNLHDQAYKESQRRADEYNRERREEQERLKARYGYYFSKRGGGDMSLTDLIRVEAYEEVVVEMAYEKNDEAEARQKIHELIPTISDAEIDEYRREHTPPTAGTIMDVVQW